MLTKTQNYYEKEQAGYIPEVYCYVSSNLTRRKFTIHGQIATESASGFWDGSRYVGDGSTYGADAGVTESEARILSISPINQTTTQTTRDLATSLSASSVGHVSASFDNADRYFTDITSGELSEEFVNYTFEVRQGFNGLDFADELPLFRGVTIDTQLDNISFRIRADAITSSLYDVWEVPKSSLYSNPEQQNQAIPLVLGNLRTNSTQGVVVCPLIDTVNDVYALACHAIRAGVAVSLYDDDGEINSGDYTVTASGDYESIGLTIAYATFSVAPNGTVTGRYRGAVDSSGALITSPPDCIEKMLDIMGDSSQFEATSFAKAQQDAEDNAYECSGMIIADNPKAHWIADIQASFLGSWFLNQNQEIVLQYETGSSNALSTEGELLQANTLQSPQLKKTRDNIITRVLANYVLSNARIDLRFKNDANSAYLQTYSETEVSGDISKEISFNWVRLEDNIITITGFIEDLYGEPLKIYTWKEQGLENMNLEPGDEVPFSWDYQQDDDGNDLVNQIGRILNITRDVQKQSISLDFYDTGNFLLATPELWDGETRYVGDGLTYGGERAA